MKPEAVNEDDISQLTTPPHWWRRRWCRRCIQPLGVLSVKRPRPTFLKRDASRFRAISRTMPPYRVASGVFPLALVQSFFSAMRSIVSFTLQPSLGASARTTAAAWRQLSGVGLVARRAVLACVNFWVVVGVGLAFLAGARDEPASWLTGEGLDLVRALVLLFVGVGLLLVAVDVAFIALVSLV